MFELGDDAAAEHKRIGELLKELNINEAYVVGGLMKSAREVNAAIKHVETKQELIELLAKQPISGATILVKASRGIGLETIVDSL
jgi:UDP-N-acetylmuramoyl-tripeptide--D-alanyl-D-alanine ligase